MEEKEKKEILIIGPSQSGKTAMIASIQRAILNWNEKKTGTNLSIFPVNTEMEELLELYEMQVIENGYLPRTGSAGFSNYLFDLEFRRTGIGWLLGKKGIRFNFTDGPGGDLIPSLEKKSDFDKHEIEKRRNDLINRLEKASSFIVCIDSTDEKSAFDFWAILPTILRKRKKKFDRFVICLTKADRYFAERYINPLEEIESEDPIKRGTELLGKTGLKFIDMHCKETKVGICWTSAYGFIESDGNANYNKKEDKLRYWGEGFTEQEVMDNWTPYQIVEPFLFVATGISRGIKFL
ncbi:MAG: GTPase domain-containing protein [Deltaproteobacteria bacterium]|uniref:GTPase domain-containing protein n=1 Tax=Candidatus Zymogenus saltonus TaxID=2844893 RepID=A0A9D8KEW2_9DELT|nr:GTPase domain-containing protein [Candidatus Zymogenus saltonus]